MCFIVMMERASAKMNAFIEKQNLDRYQRNVV